MTIEEALAIIERERLGRYSIDPASPGADEVVLAHEGDEWVTYSTDERAAVHGVVSRFGDQAAAVEDFVEKLRLGKEIADLMGHGRP